MRAIARLLADLSRARRALLLGLSLLCVLVAAGLGLGLEGLVRSHRAEAERHRWSFWQVTQAQIELQRFSATLARSAAGDPSALAELPLRLDLLWGRIQQLEILESWEDSPGLSALLDRLPEMLGVLRLIEEALPPAPGRLPELLARLSRLEEPLVEAGRLLHAIRQDRERARQLEVARHVAAFAAGFLLLVLANAVLVALLWRRSLQAQAAQRRAEEASAHSRAASLLLRTVIDHTPALISAYGPDLRCVFVNRAVVEYTGRPEQELVGRRPTEAGLSPVLEADLQAVLAQGQPIAAREREFVHADGSRRVLVVTTAPVAAEAGLPVRLLRIGLDVTERREAERRAQHLIEHDGLTGLVNRAQFARALAAAAEQAASRPFALHVIDLDQFRRVNDSHGQAAGDTVLLAAAARLRGIIRAGDLAARLGGDEFAVLQRIGDPADAAALAQRVVAVLAQPYQVNGVSVRCTASLGAVAVHQPGDPPEALFARAELALREARRAGRGRFALFRPEMEDEAAARRALQADLVQALAEGGLHIVFQPKFRLPGRRLAGVEALLRWTHPRHGPLSPALFVPLAEEAGLALPLARFVLRAAARQAAEWRAAGLELPVAVNLSAELVAEGHVLALVREALEEADLPAELLEIEVTESTFIGDSAAARKMFASLGSLGVSIALDDFGTGFSSLAYLQDLPVDVIKVDRSFVAAIERGGAAPRIVETVVRLAHSLGAQVVAEGVETEEQLRQLHALGCDMVQGFLLARPMPAEAVLALARAAAAA